MCGILGQYNFSKDNSVDEHRIRKATTMLSHRGPDEEGHFHRENISLGARRLKVIDLNTGSQPIHNEDSSIWVVYNGEIYNYQSLREYLEPKLHNFYTECDTEIIVHLYEQEGEGFIKKLNGMFSFALWDSNKKQLILARDRFGIKPLFYSKDANSIKFSSEIAPLLTLDGVSKEIDYNALSDYFSYNYIPEPNSIFKDIKKLLPGHYLIVDSNGNVEDIDYWDLHLKTSNNLSFNDSIDKLDELFSSSVNMMLRSDVSLGAYLSSGLDSSAIVSYMRRFVKDKIKTFTIGFKSSSYDELKGARKIAKMFDTDHTEIPLDDDIPKLAHQAIDHFGEPFGDSTALATMILTRETKKTVTVILTGDGGDEILAGYPTYYVHRLANLYKKIPKSIRNNIIKKMAFGLPASYKYMSFDYLIKRFVEGADYPYKRGHYMWKATFYNKQKRELFSNELNNLTDKRDSYSVYEQYFDRASEQDIINQLLYCDFKTFLLSNGLVRVDRMTMASGVEARVPFLENNLVDFLATMPSSYKVKGSNTKYIFRELLKRNLPKKITSMKKKGWILPLGSLIRGSLKPFITQSLSSENIKKTEYLNPEFVSSILNQHFKGRMDNGRQIWNIAMFMLWYNKFIKEII